MPCRDFRSRRVSLRSSKTTLTAGEPGAATVSALDLRTGSPRNRTRWMVIRSESMDSASRPHHESHASWAVVLAAGQSTRMGRPKALLEVSGATFLELIMKRVRVAKIDHAVVAISNDDDKIINGIDLSEIGLVYNAA